MSNIEKIKADYKALMEEREPSTSNSKMRLFSPRAAQRDQEDHMTGIKNVNQHAQRIQEAIELWERVEGQVPGLEPLIQVAIKYLDRRRKAAQRKRARKAARRAQVWGEVQERIARERGNPGV